MIIFIMLVTIISIGLLGILIVITYTCVTTKSFHNFCASFLRLRRTPTPIKYASDEDYAEQARNSKDLDQEFQKSIEFHGEEMELSASSEDEDEAQIEDCGGHHRCCSHHDHCDCTDDGGDSSDDFVNSYNNDNDNRCSGKIEGNAHLVLSPPTGLSGMIV